MGFERGQKIIVALGLGGYSIETLQPGVVLECISSFGLTNAGTMRGYNTGTIRISSMDWCKSYLVVTNVYKDWGKKGVYNIKFIQTTLKLALKWNEMKIPVNELYKSYKHVDTIICTKRKFENRLKIIRAGY